jgi:magnesium-transporting ATPase (P-type)
MSKAWYTVPVERVMEDLDTGVAGISDSEVRARLERYGANEIEFRKTPAWVRFLRQFNDPMVIILLVTACVTGTLTALGSHMLPDTIVIAGVVLLNAILGFVQEGKAEGALDALRNMMVQEALVVRDRVQHRIPARELVPGDLVVLESGDKIPADVRFLETADTHVDEAALTGESIPVRKHIEAIEGSGLVPADQSNMGFSGTYITRGTARAIVVDTGPNTVFGQIADMVKAAEAHLTPLQQKMQEFVRTLIIAILVVGGFNFGLGISGDVARPGDLYPGPLRCRHGGSQRADPQVAGCRNPRCDLGNLFRQDGYADREPHDRHAGLCRRSNIRRHRRGL